MRHVLAKKTDDCPAALQAFLQSISSNVLEKIQASNDPKEDNEDDGDNVEQKDDGEWPDYPPPIPGQRYFSTGYHHRKQLQNIDGIAATAATAGVSGTGRGTGEIPGVI